VSIEEIAQERLTILVGCNRDSITFAMHPLSMVSLFDEDWEPFFNCITIAINEVDLVNYGDVLDMFLSQKPCWDNVLNLIQRSINPMNEDDYYSECVIYCPQIGLMHEFKSRGQS
jgi:hypothetical protein